MRDERLSWSDLSSEVRESLSGKLIGLWGAESDEAAFNSWAVDKQQGMLQLLERLKAKDLWHLVRQVTNVYGEGGVALEFIAWPMLESTLKQRNDFTSYLANHSDTDGGFYEKDRDEVILHFLFREGEARMWFVHFDLYSPVHSMSSAVRHFRYEFLGKVKPDWRSIKDRGKPNV
jgi:hypothetical protein